MLEIGKKYFLSIFILTLIVMQATAQQQDVPETKQWKERYFLCKRDAPLGKKLLRAELMSFTLQGLGYAQLALTSSPAPDNDWDSRHFNEDYRHGFTKAPVWDDDGWFYNYFGHPITGAIHYSILRSQNVPALHSFIYSTAQSVIWEYLIECSQERPSIQDLIFTSTTGSVIGEAIHQATLAMKKKKFRTVEKVIVTIINPMYVINNGYRPTKETAKWIR